MRREDSEFWKAGYTKQWWLALPPDQRANFLAAMSDEEVEAWGKDWRVWGRDKQLAPEGNWRMWLLICGRGFGKTKTAVENIIDMVQRGEKGNLCLLGQSQDDVREVMVEGVSGFLACSPNNFRPKWRPSRGSGLLEWPNGAIGHVYSAEDPEAMRGPEFDLAWIDEIMAFKAKARVEAESNLRFALRLGPNPQRIYTSTPKPHIWLKKLVQKILNGETIILPNGSVYNVKTKMIMTQGTTYENEENLPGAFLEGVRDDYEGTQLGKQELLGQILTEVEGALWTEEMLERARLDLGDPIAFAKRCEYVTVAVDPNMKAGGTSHAAGITVCGTYRGHRYLIADRSIRGASPQKWGQRVVEAYEQYDADEVVAEVNQGGDLVKYVVDQEAENMSVSLKVHMVDATKGKRVRAEPVAAAYEQGKIFHVAPKAELVKIESQMCELHEGVDTTGEDFDRCDSLVWGMTRLAKKAKQVGGGVGTGILTFSAMGVTSGETTSEDPAGIYH